MTLNGIDISHWQKTINLSKIKSDFIIMKATEGYGYTDPKFNDFIKQVKGIRGVYHFARADLNPGTAGARKEAGWFVKTVKPYLDGNTILVLDYEAESVKAGTGWAKTFLDSVYEETGVRALLYINSSVESKYNWSQIASKHELWLANYGSDQPVSGFKPPKTPKTQHWTRPVIHQYSQKGKLAGYSGQLDLNVAFLSLNQWKSLAKGKTVSSSKSTKPSYTMVSPVEGYLTQRFKPRVHLGLDIGTGGKKMPVYASFPGKVVQIIRGVKPGNRKSTYAPGRTSNVVIIQNVGPGTSNDKEFQAYGHVTALSSLKEGDQVKAGQKIGDLDRSGNTTGWHLHLEMWSANRVPYDPMLAFNRWGVSVGEKPKGTSTPKPAPKPKPKPKPKRKNGPSGQGKARTRRIQRNLAKMGYDVGPDDGIYGPRTEREVRNYQRDQNKWADAGLFVDGDWASKTQKWYNWVKKLQKALPKWKGIGKLVVDGGYLRLTHNAVRTLQSRNGLIVDGIAKRKTISFMRKNGSKVPHRPN